MSRTNQTNHHDTSFTNIFVGNLTWRTTSDDLKRYFERFGEVINANVVCETYPGRSKGYGFVIFRDAASAIRALENPKPVIDGRTTNCNLASLGAKKNMNHPNNNGSLNQATPPHQYQPQHINPYCPLVIWDQASAQYFYMYNNPCYPYPTQMINYHNDFTYRTQQNRHQTNIRHVVTSAPQRSSARLEIINETDREAAPQRSSVRTESISKTDQELIADVAHHDNEEAVTKPDSDVHQQTAAYQEGEIIGEDGDIKQDLLDLAHFVSELIQRVENTFFASL